MSPNVDVLIPTCNRPAALAVTLTSLCAQAFRGFRVVISDQTVHGDSVRAGEVQATLRVLRAHGHTVETHRHLPPRGLAEHRHFLLDRVQAPFALFLDDDLILEPGVIGTLLQALTAEQCGFVGQAVIGLSHADDVRPHEQHVEFWEGRVRPEAVPPDSPAWRRHRLHNAANLYHVQRRLALPAGAWRTYRVAWIGGCVMYDTGKLRACGGFGFWRDLPVAHCGEDVLAQLRVMARYGGCGILPSGVYHQEVPTTVPDRRVDAPRALGIGWEERRHAPR
ncbi:glycosyl transferase [Sulfurifustis variabilis]|uniref:Glycosyl transferase n=1 Tax=Sulfurifustis variabilis TaxID=1675686 RepID=A0A1B4V437_9GAMM|nr:glycosyltransferase family A protein [Sulfurifustis variabilis]BAU48279.1 glycosyl transferase [Sulfurifustis variabilis]